MLNNIFNSKRWIKPFIIIFGAITIIVFSLSFIIDNDTLETIGISLLTTYYFACIRPLVGYFIDKRYHNKFDYNKKWFKERKFERKLYGFLKVKKWKHLIPTYQKKYFDIKTQTLEGILGAMCQAEVVHEIMLILSFLPLLLIISYGTALVFIISSFICALFELCLIIVQRYNRPRIYKLINRT